MADRNDARRDGPAGEARPSPEPVRTPEHGFWWKLWLIVKTLQARLRFVVILAAIGGLIAYWDTLSAYYEKWTRPTAAAQTNA